MVYYPTKKIEIFPNPSVVCNTHRDHRLPTKVLCCIRKTCIIQPSQVNWKLETLLQISVTVLDPNDTIAQSGQYSLFSLYNPAEREVESICILILCVHDVDSVRKLHVEFQILDRDPLSDYIRTACTPCRTLFERHPRPCLCSLCLYLQTWNESTSGTTTCL